MNHTMLNCVFPIRYCPGKATPLKSVDGRSGNKRSASQPTNAPVVCGHPVEQLDAV